MGRCSVFLCYSGFNARVILAISNFLFGFDFLLFRQILAYYPEEEEAPSIAILIDAVTNFLQFAFPVEERNIPICHGAVITISSLKQLIGKYYKSKMDTHCTNAVTWASSYACALPYHLGNVTSMDSSFGLVW